jgi:hypothetical protein
LQAEADELREETVFERGREEEDDSSDKNSDSDGSTKSYPGKEVKLSEEPEKEVQRSEQPDKEVQLSEEPEKEVKHSEQPEKEVKHSEQPEKEDHLSEEPKKEVQLSEEPQKEVQASQIQERETLLSKESDKEGQLLKETKANKVQSWSWTRPSLHVIENMMSSRVKNIKDMKYRHNTINGDHLPSIKKTGSSGGSSVDEIDKELCIKETSDDNVDKSTEETNVDSKESPESFFPWKELEFLVRGGVPKDLRGEVNLTPLSLSMDFLTPYMCKSTSSMYDSDIIGVASLCRCEDTSSGEIL